MPEQQIVEIAKAIGADARIVIMDEPTASLTDARGRAPVRRHRARCAREGAGIVYISHRLEEVFAIADRITVLRDGETVGDARRPRRSTAPELIRLMVGRALTAVFPKRRVPLGEVALELRTAVESRARGIHDVSLSRAARRDPRRRRPRRLGPDASWPRRSSA